MCKGLIVDTHEYCWLNHRILYIWEIQRMYSYI